MIEYVSDRVADEVARCNSTKDGPPLYNGIL